MNSSRKGKLNVQNVDLYTVVGLGLVVFGILFSEISYFFFSSTPLTAVGLSSLILGVVTLMVPGEPIGYARLMINESFVNVEGILEQFDAKERCVFIPPRDGRVFAYVPISTNPEGVYEQAWKSMDTPIRMLTEVDGKPGLMVFLPVPYGILSTVEEGSNLEKALNYLLVERFGILESVTANQSAKTIAVSMHGSISETKYPRVTKVLGNLPTCIAGCLISHILKKPIILKDERSSRRTILATFEMLNKNE